MDTLEIHIENDADILDDLNHINAVVIDSSDIPSGFINTNLLDPFASEDDKPQSLQSFDVFCESSNIIKEEGSMFSLEDASEGGYILVADSDITQEGDAVRIIKAERKTHPMEGQVVQMEDGSYGVLTFVPDMLCSDQMVKLPDGTLGSIIPHKLKPVTKTEASAENEFIIIGLDEEEEREEDILFELEEDIEMEDGENVEEEAREKNKCAECNKCFSSPHHMKVHKRIHTGVRPYKCPIEYCDKAFSTQYSRKAHIRTHTGEKPYRCSHERCMKAFKTSGDLQKHVRTHTGERPFPCPVLGCDRSFTTSNIRKVHIRTHTGEKPYVCSEPHCGKSFASATNYKNHMRIHSGEKPYVCQVRGCQKRFTEYSSLYKHSHVHSDIRPFICDECPRSYRQECTLNSHRRAMHQRETGRNKGAKTIRTVNQSLPSYMMTVNESLAGESNNSSNTGITIIHTGPGNIGSNGVEKYFLMFPGELSIPTIKQDVDIHLGPVSEAIKQEVT